jgi:hypothetical protein
LRLTRGPQPRASGSASIEAWLRLDLNLAIGAPALMPQTPVRVTGFKPEIDGQA